MPFPVNEISRLAGTYQVAIAVVAAEVFRDIVAILGRLSTPTNPKAAPAAILSHKAEIASIVREGRRKNRRLSVAYTRLDRALNTGYTFPDLGYWPDDETIPLESAPGTETIDKLREEFVATVKEFAPSALKTNIIPDSNPLDEVDDSIEVTNADGSVFKPYDIDEFLGELLDLSDIEWEDDFDHREGDLLDDVFSEELDRLGDFLDELDNAADREVEDFIDFEADYFKRRLERERKRQRDIDASDKKWQEKYQKREEELARSQALLVAADMERIAQNAARHFSYVKGRLDGRVSGFIRVHYPEGDPIPCGFCAVLLSRGAIYKSKKSAGGVQSKDEDGRPLHNPDEYHRGCHCSAVEIYNGSILQTDERFELNRKMEEHWKTYVGQNPTGGLSGFRSYMRKIRIKSGQDSDFH